MNIEINPFRLPKLSLPQAQQVQQTLQTLKIGQLLDAVVAGYTRDNHVQLKLNGQTIQARAELPLTPGERLQLQVTNIKDTITLKLVQRDPAQSVIQQTMRQALPVQAQNSQLLSNIQFLKQVDGQQLLQQLPKPTQQLLQQFVEAVPSLKSLGSTPTLVRAINQSGVFLENQLLAHSQNPQQVKQSDIKALLTQLIRAFEQHIPAAQQRTTTANLPTSPNQYPVTNTAPQNQTAPHAQQPSSQQATQQNTAQTQLPIKGALPLPQAKTAPTLTGSSPFESLVQEITQQLKSVLARVQLHQVASMPTEAQPQPTWLLEVPFQHQGELSTMQLLIEQQAKNEGEQEEKAIWSITLAMDFDQLGAMQAKVSLLSANINVEFWFENKESWQTIQKELPQLQDMLTQQGLQINQLEVHHGLIEDFPHPPDAHLLDLEI